MRMNDTNRAINEGVLAWLLFVGNCLCAVAAGFVAFHLGAPDFIVWLSALITLVLLPLLVRLLFPKTGRRLFEMVLQGIGSGGFAP